MATITSHTLNGTDGTHAGGIKVSLVEITAEGNRRLVFETETDPGGRMARELDPTEIDSTARYELVLETGTYWEGRNIPHDGPQIMDEIVVRFRMPDTSGKYHIPLILSPNSYSVWWSS